MEISVESLSDKFTDHLNTESNFRIIFSGKFGMGKTFFLNKYFGERRDRFNKILISPVNYVVSANEDIFELIKADILKELFLTGKLKLKYLPKDTLLQKISKHLEDNPLALLKFMVKSLAKINPVVETPAAIIEAIGALIDKYKQKLKNKPALDKTCEEKVAEYLSEGEAKIGSIYEHNYVTKVINVFLDEIRGEKKNVLIIDDLDRIDPEHIFRILNVLSAHNNHYNDENKFLFDHIILVCDIHNIKKIYEHRYGKGVDFEGYIDKFYSTDIFLLSNEEALKFYIESWPEPDVNDHGFTKFLQYVLTSLVDIGELSVRKIIKHIYDSSVTKFVLFRQDRLTQTNLDLDFYTTFMVKYKDLFVDSSDLRILQFFKLMAIIYGEFNEFYKSFKKLTNGPFTKQREHNADDLKEVLEFIALQKHIATNTGDALFFKLTHGEGWNREVVLKEIAPPQVALSSITYDIVLKWNSSNMYTGQESYFNGSRLVNSDRHQYIGGKPRTSVTAQEIFLAVDQIIQACQEKNFLRPAGVIFKKE